MLPALGAVTAPAVPQPAAPAELAVPAEAAAPAAGAGAEAAPAAGAAAAVEPSAGAEGVSFGGTLSKAIASLESSQQSAAGAAQGIALGTSGDPESAVVAVEDAQLQMQLAAQIRTKATEAAQTIFQTQV